MIRILSSLMLLGSLLGSVSQAQQCSCQPPSTLSGGVCIPPSNTNNACDDGSSSGHASLVSTSVTGANPAAKFQSLINKKLACCANSFDPADSTQLKYDCVDNAAAASGTFDDLWTGADPADSGSQPYAVVLTTGGNGTVSGKPVSGFYTMSGSRCNEYSEFAGVIKAAKVNPGQISGQQEKIGSTNCSITAGTTSVTPPISLTTPISGAGKKVPWDGSATNDCTQAANMRRCPILVRAAMVATCSKNPNPPVAQTAYKDTANVTHCLSASTIRFYVRIEQIYEIAGMPRMAVIDTLQDQNGVNTLSLASLIQSKIGNSCPGTTAQFNGSCMGCTGGCGGAGCSACPANTYSDPGSIQCIPCPLGQSSPPGATACM